MNKNFSRIGSEPSQEVQKENFMNKTKHLLGMSGLVLSFALPGFRAYSQPSPSLAVNVGLPSVEIRSESDFYEPLNPYGRWEVVGSYGRCWRPGHVAGDWRPYCNGNWERTEAGWYWVSDEPWGWATYHYGRWDFSDQDGWYWVPQTQWAPAWVSWHTGGGYIGWAPLYTSDVRVIAPRAYVFVEERHFMEPVRSSTVVVNNLTIINQTVIHEAPTIAVVEKASGRKIQALPVQELRHKTEAAVVAKQGTPTAANGKRVQPPIRSEAQPAAKKAVAASAPSGVEKPGVAPRAPAPLAPTARVSESENFKPIPSQPEPRPVTAQPAALKEPTAPKAATHVQPSKAPIQKVEKAPGKPLPPAPEKVNGDETNGKAAGEPHSQKPEEHHTPPEKPVVPSSL
jgi:Family of unknown function (DUF6600)